MKLQRLAITCGGTGGHFYPGLSIARVMQERGGEVLLLLSGVHSLRQSEIARSHGVPAEVLPPMPSPHGPRSAARFLTGLVGGSVRAGRLLGGFRPQAVLGMGSFASLPALLAADLRGIPCFLHDGNARIGKANRWMSRRARFLGTAFPAVNAGGCRCGVGTIGMPVRPELEAAAGIGRGRAIEELNRLFGSALAPELPVILIFGGSQGASVFNSILPQALNQLGRSDFQVLHLSGPAKLEETRSGYAASRFGTLVQASSERMELFLGAADLVVARSGGSTVAELALFGRASLLIPYPHAAENHQFDNAGFLSESGAAVRLENAGCTVGAVRDILLDFLDHPENWLSRAAAAAALGSPGAAGRMLDRIAAGLGPDS